MTESIHTNLHKPLRSLIICIMLLIAFPYVTTAQVNQTDDKGRKQGEWIKVHPETGNVAFKATFKNDLPVGTTERYYEDGALQAHIVHRKDGVDASELFHPDGKTLMAKGNYKNRDRDSTWHFYSVEGRLITEEQYQKGIKHGLSRTYYEDGSLSEKVEFQDGKRHGLWEQYYPDGTLRLKATAFEGIQYEGDYLSNFPNGKPMLKGKYVEGKKEGSWYSYLETGAIEVIHVYRKGKVESEHPQNGQFETYYPDDILRSSYTYKNGKKDGPFKEFYQKGEWRTETQVDEFGNARPVQKLYGTQLMKEGKYREGELHGEVVTYTEKGKVEKREKYDMGKKIN